jgi:hypothetical protein
MGRFTDASPVSSCDVFQNHDGGDSEVKMTRLATGALRWPRGIKTQSGTSSEEVACQLVNHRAADQLDWTWSRHVPRWLEGFRAI